MIARRDPFAAAYTDSTYPQRTMLVRTQCGSISLARIVGKRRMTRIGVSSAIAGRMIADVEIRSFLCLRRLSRVCGRRDLAERDFAMFDFAERDRRSR